MSSRPSDSVVNALRDIAHHIVLVAYFIDDMDFPKFAADIRTVYASVRCLEIISEASRRLPSDMKGRHAAIDWRGMAAAGNVYRHDYDDVEAQLVWRTATFSLPALKIAIEAELAKLS